MTTKTEQRQLVNAWVEHDVVQALEAQAERADRSRSAEIRIALREYVERDVDEKENTWARTS
jgi:predicted transcriptional regulator